MSAQDQLDQARTLIKEKRYQEARALLRGIDHPKAREWLDKINDLEAAQNSPMTSPISQSSGGIGINLVGIIVLLITTVVGGVAVGAALHFSGRLIYLICVSPIIAAFVAGYIMYLGVKVGKVRSGFITFIFGVVMGAIAYGSFWYGDYLWFVEDTRSIIRQEDPRATNAEIDRWINELLEIDTGSTGFVGFVRLQIQEGMSIGSTSDFGSDDEGTGLPSSLTMIYYGIELLILVAGPVLMGLGQSGEPFCENSNEWLSFVEVGTVSQASAEQFLQALQVNDFSTARTFVVKNGDYQRPYLKIESGDCGADQPTGTLRVTAMRTNNKGQEDNKQLLQTTLARSAFDALVKR